MKSKYLPGEQQNFTWFMMLCVDFLKLPLKDILSCQITPSEMYNKIKLCTALKTGKHRLRPDQEKICFLPPPKLPDYNNFDVCLLYTLIRNLCPSLKPSNGWGNNPIASATLIGDDIERVRLFRNNYFAHKVSSEMSDSVFNNMWKELKSVVNRIQNYTSKNIKHVNYEEKMKEIKAQGPKSEDMKKYKHWFEVLLHSMKQVDYRDEPEITIKGDEEVICGKTAYFEAECTESSNWSLSWQKVRGGTIQQIDMNVDKYCDSTDRKLIIHHVCKEDEGNYQAALSQVSNGKNRIILSNVIVLKTLGELPYLDVLYVTKERDAIIIHYNHRVPERLPEAFDIKWSKDGEDIDLKNKKYVGGKLEDNSIMINPMAPEDKGCYSCTVTNDVGSFSRELIFDVPHCTISKDSKIIFGSVAKFESDVLSCPPPDDVEWQNSIDGNNFITIDIDKPKYFGSSIDVDCPLLLIQKTTFDDRLFYRLLVRNKIGESFSNTIYLNVTGSVPNVIISHTTCIQAKTVKLIGNVFLYDDSPAIQNVFWTKNGEKIDTHRSGGRYLGMTIEDPSLIINSVNHHDAGEYQLTAINPVGSTQSDIIVLDVPNIYLEKSEIEKDGTQKFTVTIHAVPSPECIRWKVKRNNVFELLDVNAKDYKGTSDTLPHPVLVVKKTNQTEDFQVVVRNFIGESEKIIQRDEKPLNLDSHTNTKHGCLNSLFNLRGANIRFADIFHELAENFPMEKLNQLKDFIKNSLDVGDNEGLKQAATPRECFRILNNTKHFTSSDVIFIQYLLKRTDCKELYKKCYKYAEEQNALCFYEKPPENGATDVQFHVRGNLSDYSSKHIQDIKETVSEIVGCRADEIIIGGFSQSTSFFVHLLIKDAYLLKLSFMSKKEKENLAARNIDFLTFNSDIVRMDCSKEEIKGIVEKDDLPHQSKYQHVRWIDKPAAQPTGNGQLKRNLSEKDSDDSSSDEKHKRLDDNEAPQVMLNTFSSLSQNEEKSNQEELSRSTLPHNSSYGHHSEGPSKVSENLQTWIQTGENIGATYIINHADGNNVEKSNEKPSNKNISDDDMYATSTCTDDTDINNEDDSDSSDCYSEDDSSNFDGDDDFSDNNVSQLISSC